MVTLTVKAAAEPTPASYRAILLDSRKAQLRLTLANVRRLETTFDRAIDSIIAKVSRLPDERIGTAWHRAQLQLMADIRNTMDGLKRDYHTLLEAGMAELAQNAASREAATAHLVNAPEDHNLFPNLDRTLTLSTGAEVQVQFGRLALQAVERVTTRYYSDGLKLSDRLYRMDIRARKVIEDTIVQGLVEQISARELGKRLEGALKAAGSANPRFDASRIARTEINSSHTEAFLLSTQNPDGTMKDYIAGRRFCLSSSHPSPDVCDLYASRDAGAGPGVYREEDYPTSHPFCICYGLAVLKAFPDVAIPAKKPNVDAVPANQVRRFEQEYPPVAGAV